ncbi:MAG TPA: hypothetical protein VJP85_05865 [Candidatus Baltobacteraceae bacterium]|nr:hypothetical protein [Candidatus Baltobacteraceae bacterium]
MFARAERSRTFDLLVSGITLWIACGFFLDAWAHGHVPVETFFTPYHGIFYSGMLALVVVLAVFARRGGIPYVYRYPLLGVPIFIAAGVGDLVWHQLLGIEEGVDALLSPTHQGLGLGIFFISAGPILSALRNRDALRTLADQLPLIFALATWIELIHFGTAYAFDPAAGMTNAPPPAGAFTPDYLTAITLGYYKTGMGVLVVLFQSAIMAGFALFAGTRFSLRPGALPLMYVLGNFAAAAAFTNDTALLPAVMAMSLVAGIVGDGIVASFRPSAERIAAYRLLGTAVPASYFITYFIVTAAADRVWWDWNVTLGAIVWAGAIGFGLTLLSQPRTRSA